MYWRKFASVCLLCSLSACTSLPEIQGDAITTAEVILNIKCELRNALHRLESESEDGKIGDISWLVDPNNPKKSWNSGFTLTLKTYRKGGVNSDTSFVMPLNPGSFTLGFKTGLSGEATREEKIDFKENFAKIEKFKICPEYVTDNKNKDLLEGRLGFYDLLEKAMIAYNNKLIEPTSLAFNLDFVVKYNGSLSPKFNLIPVANKTLSASLNLSGDKNDYHLLKVVFSPPPKQSKCSVPKVKFKDNKTDKKYTVCPDYVVQLNPGNIVIQNYLKQQKGFQGQIIAPDTDADEAEIQKQLNDLRTRNAIESLIDERTDD